MKKAKNIKHEGPVDYNKSILAAFERQIRGRTCPICNTKFSLSKYRAHRENCKLAENDGDVEVLASYTREEAILLRAGPEIVLNDETLNEKPDTKKIRIGENDDVQNIESGGDYCVSEPSGSRGNNDDFREEPENELERPIKTSPEWNPERRRSRRLLEKNDSIVNAEAPLKKETATISEVLEAIKHFESRTSSASPKWPHYMHSTVEILKRVISTPKTDGTSYADNFWVPHDIITFYRFIDQISESAKCLLVKLFIRKQNWYLLDKLEQKYPEIVNIRYAAVELSKWQFVDDDSSMKTLEEALEVSDLTVLRNVARKFKIDGNKNRPELLVAIQKFAKSQQSIFGGTGNVEISVIRALKQELGTCLRIKGVFVDLFKAVFTIYCPFSTNSALAYDKPLETNVYSDLLFSMYSLKNGQISFPAPNPCRYIVGFFRNRTMLFDYVIAKSFEKAILDQVALGNLDLAFDIAIDAKERIDQCPPNYLAYYSELELHERKHTPVHVLVRCCGQGSAILEKQKKYGMAVEWLKDILIFNKAIQPFCWESRGLWWERLILNLDSHLKEKKECARMIQLALQDPHVFEKDALSIQDRALRLKEMPPNFRPPINIGMPEKKTISATTISKNLGDGRVNRFVIRDEQKEEDVECSVEEIVRRHYFEKEGFSCGLHDEGATWHTIFGMLFYDVIFSTEKHVESTWFSELMNHPSDLNNTLYSMRKSQFEERFEWLKKTSNEEIGNRLRKVYESKNGEDNGECAWSIFPNGVEEIVDLFNCLPRAGIIAVCRRLAENYRNSRSGFPDLTLWNPETKKIAVVEVKGPGDRLSTKQRLWLSFFGDHGIRAEVCHVTAENSKRLN